MGTSGLPDLINDRYEVGEVIGRGGMATVHVGQAAGVLTAGDAVRLPLDNGWVATAWGAELHTVVRAVEAVA